MLKRLVMFACVLSLAACNGMTAAPPGTVSAIPSPAAVTGLNTTPIDDQGIRASFLIFDTLVDLVTAARATGVLVPGTPKALVVQSGIRRTSAALQAASSAQKAGSAVDYTKAFAEAEKALAAIRAALKTGG